LTERFTVLQVRNCWKNAETSKGALLHRDPATGDELWLQESRDDYRTYQRVYRKVFPGSGDSSDSAETNAAPIVRSERSRRVPQRPSRVELIPPLSTVRYLWSLYSTNSIRALQPCAEATTRN
jgi:hypothetical protein